MEIILDANIYAADYRMRGVSFRTLFEYMRRTKSRLVLPHAIREEVVNDYGRRLKSESKVFEQVWNRYRHLDLDKDPGIFQKPDIKRKMITLRRKLMKPADQVKPLYVPELKGAFIEEAFMRGVQRKRPARDDGEELRDVILWLWALEFCGSVDSEVAFISGDSGFWAKDGVHPHIDSDVQSKKGRIGIYRSITDFLQRHAPAPADATGEWVQQHFQIETVESQLIDSARRELSRQLNAVVRDVALQQHEFENGKVYDVAKDTQFAELKLKVTFTFTYAPAADALQQSQFLGPFSFAGGLAKPGGFGSGLLNRPTPLQLLKGRWWQPEAVTRNLKCDAEALVSVRAKKEEPSEITLDDLTFNREQLWRFSRF